MSETHGEGREEEHIGAVPGMSEEEIEAAIQRDAARERREERPEAPTTEQETK